MPPNNRQRLDLITVLCRICAIEDPNSIPIFGVEGQKQNIIKKIRACLPVDVREDDIFPKQICLTCLTKLDSFFEMHKACKEAQVTIEKKFFSLRRLESLEQANSARNFEDTSCGKCKEEVYDNQLGIGCEGVCQKWFHISCIKMSTLVYKKLCSDPKKSWICPDCRKKIPHPKICHSNVPIEERLKNLTESYPVSYGTSAVICLAPEPTPPPPPPPPPPTMSSITREPTVVTQAVAGASTEPVIAPVTYLTSATVPPSVHAAPSPASEEIYPQALIQVSQISAGEQPVIYQSRPVPVPVPAPASAPVPTPTQAPALSPQSVPRRRLPVPKPMATLTSPQRPAPTTVKRQNGEAQDGPQAKKPCRYCNKWFTDDIIDHHISLHLRQTFRTCLDCNKNFRSEEALERHRCGANETIDLDAYDEEPIVL